MPSGRAIRAGRAFVELFADNSKLVRGLRAARAKIRAFGQRLQNIGTRIAATTAAMAVPVGIAVRTFAGFEDQMAQVRAVTGATDRDFGKLTQRAKELGRTTSFTAAQVAGAMTELGRAGFKPAQILDAIGSVLNLARATATDLPRAAEIASAAMRGFGLTAKDTTYIADVLTATANNSAQGLEDIGESMKYVAPMAKEAGEDIRDTAAALGVLANNGIKGSMAGTALARAYKNLSKTGSQTMLKKLGVDAVDANGNLRKVADILSDLGQSTAKMGSAQRLSIFEQLFGRGSAAALKLASGANFQNMQKTLSNVGGTAARTAKVMDNTLGGAFRKLWSAVEGVQIAMGEALGPVIAKAAAWITRVSGRVTAWVQKNRALLVTVVRITAAVFAGGVALIVLGLAISAASHSIGALLAVLALGKVAFAAFGTVLTFLLSPLGLVTVAVGVLGAYILKATSAGAKALGWLGDKFGSLADDVHRAWKGIGDALASGDIGLAVEIAWLTIKKAWQEGTKGLREGWADVVTAMQVWWLKGSRFIARAWISLVAVLKKAWTGFSGWWKKAQEGLATSMTWLVAKAMGASDEEADAAQKHANETHDARIKQIDAETARRQKAHDAEFNALDKRIDQNYDREMAAIGKAHKAKIAAIDAELKETRAKWEKALAEAAARRAEITVEGDEGPGHLEGPQELLNKIKTLASDLKYNLNVGGARGSVAGTFGAMMLGGLGAGHTNIQERTAKAAEATAKNTKDMKRKMDAGPRFMR